MAKKATAKKLTPNRIAYNRELARIRRFLNRAEHRGYYINDYKFWNMLTKKRDVIRKRDIERLKKLTPSKLYEMSVRVDVETGELTPGSVARKEEKRQVALKAAETRRRNRESAQAFYGTPPVASEQKPQEVPAPSPVKPTPPPADVVPDGGKIIFYNVVQEYLSRLSADVGEVYTNPNGQKRRKSKDAIDASKEARSTLLRILQELVSEIGESGVGWIFQDNADDLTPLFDYVLYGSDGSRIQSAMSQIVTILRKGKPTMQELIQAGQEDEDNMEYDDID